MNREGALFLFFLIGLGGAAVYSGNSGLVLFFCTLLSLCVLAIIFARRNLNGINIERRFPEEFFAGREVRVELLVRSTGRTPLYGLHIFDSFDTDRKIGPVFVRSLTRDNVICAHYTCQFPTRGIAHFLSFQVRSRFPLSFLEFRLDMNRHDVAYIYPEPIEGTDMVVFKGSESGRKPKRFHRENISIREVRNGRKSGRILWKLSARRQIWLEAVPIRRPESDANPIITLQPRQILGTEKYERQISQVTDFTLKRILDNRTGEVLIGRQSLPYGSSQKQRRQLLEALAQA